MGPALSSTQAVSAALALVGAGWTAWLLGYPGLGLVILTVATVGLAVMHAAAEHQAASRIGALESSLSSARDAVGVCKHGGPERPVINPGGFKAFVDEFGIEAMPGLIASYLRTQQANAGDVEGIVQHADPVAFHKVAHKIAGGASMLSAERLVDTARGIMKDYEGRKDIDPADAARLLSAIEQVSVLLEPLTTPEAIEEFTARVGVPRERAATPGRRLESKGFDR
jgi:HPt (histidine-containing phosphotransfer) domain-containing protein